MLAPSTDMPAFRTYGCVCLRVPWLEWFKTCGDCLLRTSELSTEVMVVALSIC